jgi:ferritin heavy chain
MSSDNTHLEMFPGMDEIHEECKKIQAVRIGDGKASLARTSVASDEVDKLFNLAITYHRNAAALFQALSAFFSRDNVALPGVALYFKVVAQAETNDSYLIIDFMSKRGAMVDFGPTYAPPSDWVTSKEGSDVVVAFTKTLAIFKVQYKKINDHYNLAQKHGDAHAQFFLGNAITAVSEKIRVVSHHLSHLKMVESDKHAIKEFDRRLPFELEDYSMAAAVESTIPARLQMGTGLRAMINQTMQFDFNKDSASSIRSRATYNMVL